MEVGYKPLVNFWLYATYELVQNSKRGVKKRLFPLTRWQSVIFSSVKEVREFVATCCVRDMKSRRQTNRGGSVEKYKVQTVDFIIWRDSAD